MASPVPCLCAVSQINCSFLSLPTLPDNTRVKITARNAWVKAASPFTSGKHRWHVELITDTPNDEGSAMGVCLESAGSEYDATTRTVSSPHSRVIGCMCMFRECVGRGCVELF